MTFECSYTVSLIIEIFPPLVIGVTNHAHDVAAGMKGERPWLAQQPDIPYLAEQMIALSAIAGMAAGDKILPGGESAARTRDHMIEGEFSRRQNNPAVLAAITVTEQDVLARKGARLMGDAPILEQANDRRHRNAQQGSMQDGALLLFRLGHTLQNQDQRPASPTNIDRLVGGVQHQHRFLHGVG